ncbi:hypothetical protein HPB51_028341 [Rhipicephalus microplus]|uniref:Transposable element n=1 Tax=Rhipicephalus microplus TaxID=6941 RepID=A0A9J6CXX0_RHIMP|nr:hypothetical protein HPB51_028341 [Rhipicephalus microplus]
MIQSLLSSSKDVAHILPVAKIDAIRCINFFVSSLMGWRHRLSSKRGCFRRQLHQWEGNVIFSEPRKVDTVYKHSSDQYFLDSVHVLKFIRNNWLNQRNSGKCMFFSDINGLPDKLCVLTASFNTLLELHEREGEMSLYFLLGKFQPDCLEDRFGRYRQLSGAQYHISIRHMYEAEHKLKLQKVLELPESDEIPLCASTDKFCDALKQFQIVVVEKDIAAKQHTIPATTYVAGYCAHAALKKLTCAFCKENLVVQSRTLTIEADELITSITRGGLKFPQGVVENAVLMMNIVLEKLTSAKQAAKLYGSEKQKELLVLMTTLVLEWNADFDVCDNGHTPLTQCNSQHLLNNLCKRENNKLSETKAAKRKLNTPGVISRT